MKLKILEDGNEPKFPRFLSPVNIFKVIQVILTTTGTIRNNNWNIKRVKFSKKLRIPFFK